MRPLRKLTSEQVARLVQLALEGASIEAVAPQFGVCGTTARAYVYREGFTPRVLRAIRNRKASEPR